MSYMVTKTGAGIYPESRIESLKRSGDGGIDSEKQHLRQAAREFESLFMYEMLKTMRKTIPDDDSSTKGVLSGDLGKDTFNQMFDMELARKMAGGGKSSIADILYHSLEQTLEIQYGREQPPLPVKPLPQPLKEPITIDRSLEPINNSLKQPIAINKKREDLVPVSIVRKNKPVDPIHFHYGHFIDQAARETALDSSLIYAVIKVESNGNPAAVSPAGAKGLMQLSDSTAEDYRVNQVFNPQENILAGSRYLKHLLDRFGDLELALAAYNAGPGNVERYRGVPPFKETQEYIEKVTGLIASRDQVNMSHGVKE